MNFFRLLRMSLLFIFVISFTSIQSQKNTKLIDSLSRESKKDTSYLQFNTKAFISFSKEKIDSINKIRVQEVSISQDSLKHLLESAILSAKAIDYQKGVADAYLNLGVNYYYLGNYKAHFESQLEAIKIYETIGEPVLAAKAYGQLGYLSRRRDLSVANLLMQKAMQVAKEDSLKAKIQDIYNNYSILKLMENKFDSAQYYARKGLIIKEVVKDSFGIPYSYANLANAYAGEGKLNEALVYFKKALNIRTALKDSIGLGESYVQVAEVYQQQKKFNQALNNYKSSMFYASKKKYGPLLSYNYYQLSLVYKEIKKVDSAFHYLEKHLKLKDSLEGQAVLKELATLRVKLNTEEKEKELLQTKSDKAIAELELSEQKQVTYGLIGGLLVLFLIGWSVFQRNKQRHQLALSEQKEENLQSIIVAEEKERTRIARELHDGIVQQIGATILKSRNTFKKLGVSEQPESTELLKDLEASSAELRSISHQMMPRALEEKGLIIALEELLSNSLPSSKFKYSFEHLHIENRLPKNIEVTLYRITQELIQNIIKHSKATEVNIQLMKTNNQILYLVEDNGVGFQSSTSKGIGLKNIQSRIDLIKGSILFDSENKGTLTTIKIPL